jgi:CcmD family protein
MNKAFVIFIMILFLAVFFPGFFINASAPLYDSVGICSSFVTSAYGEVNSAIADQTKPVSNCDNAVLYKVMAVTLIIWIGISAYLIFLHVKIAALEKKTNE